MARAPTSGSVSIRPVRIGRHGPGRRLAGLSWFGQLKKASEVKS